MGPLLREQSGRLEALDRVSIVPRGRSVSCSPPWHIAQALSLFICTCKHVHEVGKGIVGTLLREQTGRLEALDRVFLVPRGRSVPSNVESH